MKIQCYLDYNATTPLLPEALEEMKPYFSDHFGNPSSPHHAGRKAARAVDAARERTSRLLGADPREVIFTSGGTESNHAVFESALLAHPDRKRIMISSVEHSSINRLAKYYGKLGYEVTMIPVFRSGAIDLDFVFGKLDSSYALCSVMWANNETGVIFPIPEISGIARAKQVLFHTDATQAVGKLPIDVHGLPIDYLTIAAHKFYGPKGIGALFVRNGAPYHSLFHGGHQERDRRAGTENVAGIVGMGKAAEHAFKNGLQDVGRIAELRDRLENALLQNVDGLFVNGNSLPRVAGTSNVTIPGILAEVLIPMLDEAGIYASSGAACVSGAFEPSRILLAMGLSDELARSSIRFSLGALTRSDEIEYACRVIPEVVAQIKSRRETKKEKIHVG